jgi:enolase
MVRQVESVRFRGILESRALPTVEAEVRLRGGWRGTGASPVAIAPGRRERRATRIEALGPLSTHAGFRDLCRELEGRGFASQAVFDAALETSATAQALGVGVRLALSLAFCRACAAATDVSLLAAIAAQDAGEPAMPRPLVNIFSGGIHQPRATLPFQQVMVAPDCGSLAANIEAALAVFAAVEQGLRAAAGRSHELSASSGLVVTDRSWRALLDELCEAIACLGQPAARLPIGIDVAAEHLRQPDGRYRLDPDGARDLTGDELLLLLRELLAAYPVAYLEDPFDAADAPLWRELTAAAPRRCLVVGDDLFATDARYLDRGLAGGILLKLNQAGTLSAALAAALAGRAAGMELCVSHRSGETEDTAMCDFAVAVGAAFIKIGGPRRGDRIARYNQLLRLAEELDSGFPAALAHPAARAEATQGGDAR